MLIHSTLLNNLLTLNKFVKVKLTHTQCLQHEENFVQIWKIFLMKKLISMVKRWHKNLFCACLFITMMNNFKPSTLCSKPKIHTLIPIWWWDFWSIIIKYFGFTRKIVSMVPRCMLYLFVDTNSLLWWMTFRLSTHQSKSKIHTLMHNWW